MTEIIPDTSKYTDLPSRFRALALIAEAHGKGETVETIRTDEENAKWGKQPEPIEFNGFELHYRIKPKPRELWKLCLGDAMVERNFTERRYAENFRAASAGLEEYGIVRFVEQP